MNKCSPVPEILLQLQICSFGKGIGHSSNKMSWKGPISEAEGIDVWSQALSQENI